MLALLFLSRPKQTVNFMEKISRLVDSRLVVYLMNHLNITKQKSDKENSSVVSDHLHFFAKCVQSCGIYSLPKEKIETKFTKYLRS
jgi:hypothetical protein